MFHDHVNSEKRVKGPSFLCFLTHYATLQQSKWDVFVLSENQSFSLAYYERVNILLSIWSILGQLSNYYKRLPSVPGSWKHAAHRVNKIQDSAILDNVQKVTFCLVSACLHKMQDQVI